jgi:sugar phosphate permease
VVPVHGHHLGFSASQIGLILGAYSGATFVIRLVMPAIGRRYSEWQIVRGALFASTLGFLLLPLVSMVSVYVAVSFFMGLALGSSLPNVLSLLHVNAPEGRSGEVFGIRVTITNIIQFTVPMMVGACGAAVGLAPVFLAFAAALGAGFGTAHQRVRQGS